MYDAHSDLEGGTSDNLLQLDDALGPFTNEMKAQGMWEAVTIVIVSDFGRSIKSNGRGTDHGWGGHYPILGGSVRGGHIILGDFPSGAFNLLIKHVFTRAETPTIPTARGEAHMPSVAP